MDSQNHSRETTQEGKNAIPGTITPLSISMIHRAKGIGNKQFINQTALDNISLVLHVESFVNQGSAAIDILVRDETGSIKGKVFKSQGHSIIKAVQEFT